MKVPDLLKNNVSVRDLLYLATFLIAGMVGYSDLQRTDDNLKVRMVALEARQQQVNLDHDLLVQIGAELRAMRVDIERLRTVIDKRT